MQGDRVQKLASASLTRHAVGLEVISRCSNGTVPAPELRWCGGDFFPSVTKMDPEPWHKPMSSAIDGHDRPKNGGFTPSQHSVVRVQCVFETKAMVHHAAPWVRYIWV